MARSLSGSRPTGTVPPAPVRVGSRGVLIRADDARIRRLHRDFGAQHFIRLPDILDPATSALMLGKIEKTPFVASSENNKYINVFTPADGSINTNLSFLLNDPALFAFVEAVTGCLPIKAFRGRIIRLCPRNGHYIRWHCDADTSPQWGWARRASLRINLSPRGFSGGALQFREEGRKSVLSCYSDADFGSAVLFRATKGSVHRNTPVVGTEPKTTLSGWFYGDPGEAGHRAAP